MNLIRFAQKFSAVYPSGRAIATSWHSTHRAYTSKATDNIDKNGTNTTKVESNSRSADGASPASTAEKPTDHMELESRIKKQIDSAILQNTLKLKDLESRIENLESRMNISRETRQIGGLEQRFWVSIWILLLLYIFFKL